MICPWSQLYISSPQRKLWLGASSAKWKVTGSSSLLFSRIVPPKAYFCREIEALYPVWIVSLYPVYIIGFSLYPVRVKSGLRQKMVCNIEKLSKKHYLRDTFCPEFFISGWKSENTRWNHWKQCHYFSLDYFGSATHRRLDHRIWWKHLST